MVGLADLSDQYKAGWGWSEGRISIEDSIRPDGGDSKGERRDLSPPVPAQS